MPNEGTETAAGERTRATPGILTPRFLRREDISFIWQARHWVAELARQIPSTALHARHIHRV